MKISVSEECNLSSYSISNATFKEWGMIKSESEDHDNTIYFSFSSNDIQDQIYSLNFNDPVTIALDLEIESFGKLELKKLDDKGKLLDGSTFRITGPNGYNHIK